MRTAILSIGILAALCVSTARGSAETGADAHGVVLREFSLTVPAGWSDSVAESASQLPDSAAWAANVPPPEQLSWAFPPDELLGSLPAEGIVVLVEADFEPEPCASTSSLHLAKADILGGPYEGQPAPHVSSGSTYAVRDGRCLFAQAWFGVKGPSEEMVSEVNRVLGSVDFVPAPAPTNCEPSRPRRTSSPGSTTAAARPAAKACGGCPGGRPETATSGVCAPRPRAASGRPATT